MASAAPSARFDSNTRELNEWLRSRGVIMPKLRIASEADGRYLQATSDIGPAEALVTVPADALLSVSSDRDAPVPSLPHLGLRNDGEFWACAGWEMRLAIVLLNEVRAEALSPWRAYVRSLPENPDSALVALSDSTLAARARSQLAELGLLDLADAYAGHVLRMYALLKACVETTVEFQEFVWAICVAQSRAFGVPPGNQFALFPGLDCANHSPRVKSELRKLGDDAYCVVGGEYKNGDAVFVNYGYKSAEQLALFYGFVLIGDPSASLAVGVEEVWDAWDDDTEMEIVRERKHALIYTLDIRSEMQFRLTLHDIDTKLIMALRVAVATEDELSQVEAICEEGKYRAVGLRNEVKVWQEVERICEGLIRDVGPMESEFESKIDTAFSVQCYWGDDRHEAAKALFRFERNRVLRATIERVRHFSSVSEKIGMVCTVLMPPSQNVIKAEMFDIGAKVGGGIDSYSMETM